MTDSISRQFARWAATLEFGDLPGPVVDKVKSFLLAAITAGVIGADHPKAREIVELVTREDGRADGARVLVEGTRVTRTGAAMANCELMHAAGMFDSYRMLTHPGPVLVAVALSVGELEGRTLDEVIVALAAGYEFECRLADDFVPTVSAHGFRPAPIFSTLGASLVVGKLLELDEDGLVAAIAIAASCASGLTEPGRARGGEGSVHEPNAARQGIFSGMMASLGHIVGSEHVIEGPAGLYKAFAGDATGRLRYVFEGPTEIDLATITEGLGERYKLLDAMFRIYNGAGYNQPVVELLGEMCARHGVVASEIEQITIAMNYLETLYPSPDFPRFPDLTEANPQTTHYFAARVAVEGSFPVVGETRVPTPGGDEREEAVARLMAGRVRLVGVHDLPMFSPEITITMRDGTVFFDRWQYDRLAWGFDELAHRLEPAVASVEHRRTRFDALCGVLRGPDLAIPVTALIDATIR